MVRFTSRRRAGRAVRTVAAAVATVLLAGPFAAPAQAQSAAPAAPTLRVALVTGIDHLNPFTATLAASTQLGRLMYEFLTLPAAADTQPTGGIAESWQPSADKLTWTFTIRSGMSWSDGQPVTAKDAAFTFNRMLTDENARTANGSYVANFASVSAPDDRTLVIKNKTPQANMLSLDVPIVPEHIWASIKDLNDPSTDALAVVGVNDGPFTLTEYKQNEFVKFTANQKYWRGAPKVAGVQFLVFQDSEAAVNALRNNEVDVINRLTPTQFNALQGQSGITTNKAPGRRYNELIMNLGATSVDNKPIGDGHPALKDVRVRQALARAVDPQTIVDRVMNGYAQPGASIVPPVFAAYHWEPGAEKRSFDPAAANAALDAAGYPRGGDGVRAGPDGRKLEFRLLSHSSRDFDRRTVEYLTGWLRDVGVAVKAEPVSDNEVDDRTTAGQYDLALSGWGTSPDPDYALSLEICANRPNAQGNGGSTATFFCDPAYEQLYKAQLNEFDPARRAEIVKQAQARFYDQVPSVVLDYDNALEAYRSANFASFTKQPQPEGVILEQQGYWGYYGATPASAENAAGGTDDGGSNTGLWIGVAVVVVLGVGGVLYAVNRRRTNVDDRE